MLPQIPDTIPLHHSIHPKEGCLNRAIHFRLNGKPVTLNTDDRRTLLWILRTDLDLTGTKFGCGEGICGA